MTSTCGEGLGKTADKVKQALGLILLVLIVYSMIRGCTSGPSVIQDRFVFHPGDGEDSIIVTYVGTDALPKGTITGDLTYDYNPVRTLDFAVVGSFDSWKAFEDKAFPINHKGDMFHPRIKQMMIKVDTRLGGKQTRFLAFWPRGQANGG